MLKCSKCGQPHDRSGQSYCLACHAAWQRRWRPKYRDLTPLQKMKDNARSYAGMYLRRGEIKRKPCRDCGARAQMHHPDYSKPLEVIWLCVPHHRAEHKRMKEIEDGQQLQATG